MDCQQISIPLSIGSRVTLMEEIDIDSEEGFTANITFEGYVQQYNPKTNKLSFEEQDIGYAELQNKIAEADGIEVLHE